MNITELRNFDVRNSIEHFYEKLDQLSLKISGGKIVENAVTYNTISYDQKIANIGDYISVKHYYTSTKEYTYFGKSISIEKLYDEAKAVYKYLMENHENLINAGMIIALKKLPS